MITCGEAHIHFRNHEYHQYPLGSLLNEFNLRASLVLHNCMLFPLFLYKINFVMNVWPAGGQRGQRMKAHNNMEALLPSVSLWRDVPSCRFSPMCILPPTLVPSFCKTAVYASHFCICPWNDSMQKIQQVAELAWERSHALLVVGTEHTRVTYLTPLH